MPDSFATPAGSVADLGRPLRWGVVGTGGIAQIVMSDLLHVPDAELVAVCSRSVESGPPLRCPTDPSRGRPPPDSVHTSVADMLSEIDVLYVATPHAQHVEPPSRVWSPGPPCCARKPSR